MATTYFDLVEETPEVVAFVDRSFQIADQIRHVLHEKGWFQRDLAEALGKKEPEISRMLKMRYRGPFHGSHSNHDCWPKRMLPGRI